MNIELTILRYLREHRSADLGELLRLFDLPPRDVAAVLAELRTHGYISFTDKCGPYRLTSFGNVRLLNLSAAEKRLAEEKEHQENQQRKEAEAEATRLIERAEDIAREGRYQRKQNSASILSGAIGALVGSALTLFFEHFHDIVLFLSRAVDFIWKLFQV